MTETTGVAGYRNYSADGTYWTVRKCGGTYWVVRIDRSAGRYDWLENFGGYEYAGAAGGAAAQLAYRQGVQDATARIRSTLHGALEDLGLGVPPMPPPAPVPATAAPSEPVDDEELAADG